jgi:uncharacterized membrane protein (DUF485 family)
MDVSLSDKIRSLPDYQLLVRKRRGVGWTLSAFVCVIYFGFLCLIAFDKSLMARPIGDGVTSWGIAAGFAIITITIALTAAYVMWANAELDRLTRKIHEEVAL